MDIQRFTERAQEAIVQAQRGAEARNNQQVEPEHLLAALMSATDSVPAEVVRKLGGRPDAIGADVDREIDKLSKVFGGQLYLSNRLRAVLSAAEREAANFKDEFVSTEHLLLAIADEGESSP